MKTTSINALAVPAFLTKLWNMVNDPETDHLICWNATGTSFIIRNEPQFTFKLLPAYYKHNNMSSFIRQLNMYGFHKLTMLEENGRIEKDEMQFYHPHFRKDNFSDLKLIKRKVSGIKAIPGNEIPAIKPEKLTGLLADVRGLQRKQTNINKQLDDMKQENAALWQEIIVLRQRHMKQQQIVNKLIHFLVSFVQNSKTVGSFAYKRPYPLMIQERKHKRSRKDSDGPTIEEIGASVNELLKESTSSSTIQEGLSDLLEEQQQQQQQPTHLLKSELPDFPVSEVEEVPNILDETDEVPVEVLYVPEQNSINLNEICEAELEKVCSTNKSPLPDDVGNPTTTSVLLTTNPTVNENVNILKNTDTSPAIENPIGSAPTQSENNVDELLSGSYNTMPLLQKETSLVPSQKISSEDFSSHINDAQNQINQLKDMFNSSFSDNSFLLSLFNSNSPEYLLEFPDSDNNDPLLSGLEVAPYEDEYEDIFGNLIDDADLAKKN